MKGGHFVTSLPSAPRSAVLQSVHETAELSNILVKRNIPKDIVLIDPGAVNRLSALLSGAVDAAIVSPEERYAALDQGMKDLMFFGKEVKNSWGTFATSEWFLKEQPKQLAGLSARSSNASDTRQDREGTIAAVAKFSELDKALSTRMYDDLVGTFTKAGYVDEQTQKNDLAIVARSPTSLKLSRPGAPTTLASRAMPISN